MEMQPFHCKEFGGNIHHSVLQHQLAECTGMGLGQEASLLRALPGQEDTASS